MTGTPVSVPARTGPAVAGAAWMIGTLLSFTTMAVAVRELTPAIGTLQVMAFRTGIGFVVLLPIIARYRFAPLRTGRLPLHATRNFIHFFGQLGWFYGVTLLPLATVFALEFTTPIWAALLAVLLLGERFTRSRVAAIALGFAGVMVIVQPGLQAVGAGTAVLLGAAFCFASTLVCTKALTRTDSALTVLFYMTLIQAPFSALLVIGDWATPTPEEFAWLCVVGVTGLTAHYCTARALSVADATIVVPIDFLRLPLIAVVAALLYDEPVRAAVLVGALLIFGGNYYNLWCERRRYRNG
jgi:drug/metabolite transporter (DMT)-like permease